MDEIRQVSRGSPGRDNGFTLVELMVALVLGGVVLGVAFQAMQAHGRYARAQTDRASVLQGSRAAVDLLADELRAADPLGLVEAGERSITVRIPRAWGIVCGHSGTALSVLFPTAAVPALVSRDEWIALPPVASSSSWQFLPVADRTADPAERTQAVQSCGELGTSISPAPGLRSQARMYRPRIWNGLGGHLGVASGEAGLEAGRPVYVFDAVRYDVSSTSTATGWWLRRNTGPALQMQPFVGPLADSAGLRFRYYDESGTTIPAPLGPEKLPTVRSVEVLVALRGRAANDGRTAVDSARTLVVLRNPH